MNDKRPSVHRLPCGHMAHETVKNTPCEVCAAIAKHTGKGTWPCQGRSSGECQHESCRPAEKGS